MTKTKVDSKIIDLYNEYIHTSLSRQDFLGRLTRLAGGSAAAAAVLPLIECNYARAAQVAVHSTTRTGR